MTASPTALALTAVLIHGEEGCRLTAYPDSRGILTIGWGHTGPDVHEGLVWTQAQADAQFARDLQAIALDHITDRVMVPLTDGQLAALCSLVYNIGAEHFATSTLLKKLNDRDYQGAHTHFADWKRAGDKPDELLPRRTREMWLFARSTP